MTNYRKSEDKSKNKKDKKLLVPRDLRLLTFIYMYINIYTLMLKIGNLL